MSRHVVGQVGLVDRAGRQQHGVDGHPEPDVTTERQGQRLLDLAAQPAFELGAGELVGDLDDGLVAVQGDGRTGLEPGALVGRELLDHALPGGHEVRLPVVCPPVGCPVGCWVCCPVNCVVHARSPPLSPRLPSSGAGPYRPPSLPRCRLQNSTYFSTGCVGTAQVRERRWARADSSRIPGHHRRSAGRWPERPGAGAGAPGVQMEDGGESRRGPNLTRPSPSRQDFIHRPRTPERTSAPPPSPTV